MGRITRPTDPLPTPACEPRAATCLPRLWPSRVGSCSPSRSGSCSLVGPGLQGPRHGRSSQLSNELSHYWPDCPLFAFEATRRRTCQKIVQVFAWIRSARLTPFIVPDVREDREVRVLSWLSVLLARCEKSDRRARETSSGVVSRKGKTLGPFGRPNEEKSVALATRAGTVPPFLGPSLAAK